MQKYICKYINIMYVFTHIFFFVNTKNIFVNSKNF